MDFWKLREFISRESLYTVKKKFFSSPFSPRFLGNMFFEGQNAETRKTEQKGRSWAAARVSSESLLFWRTHHFSLSPLQSFKSSCVSCMAAIHTFWLRRNTDCWLARDVSWSVGRFVSYKMVQLCQRKVIAKNQRSQCFLKWIKQGNTCWRGQEPLIASFMQNCKSVIWAALATALTA